MIANQEECDNDIDELFTMQQPALRTKSSLTRRQEVCWELADKHLKV